MLVLMFIQMHTLVLMLVHVLEFACSALSSCHVHEPRHGCRQRKHAVTRFMIRGLQMWALQRAGFPRGVETSVSCCTKLRRREYQSVANWRSILTRSLYTTVCSVRGRSWCTAIQKVNIGRTLMFKVSLSLGRPHGGPTLAHTCFSVYLVTKRAGTRMR